MTTWIALIRGINVGGHNKMPMATLAKVLEQAGCSAVRTYIQSGNVVFNSKSKSKTSVGKLIGDAIQDEFQFRPEVLLLTADELHSAIENNPFQQAVVEPKSLHFYFLATPPKSPDLAGLTKSTMTERFKLIDSVFYLHTPDGLGKSKLAGAVERKLGVSATARNYSTVRKLSEMVSEAD
ncbi:MAG: DUF1697 domain-containing protein [Pirellulales bacterium]